MPTTPARARRGGWSSCPDTLRTETKYGSGLHIWNVTPEQFKKFLAVSASAFFLLGPLSYGVASINLLLQLGTPAALFYNLATICIKASIIFFYLRFAAANRPFRVFAYCLLFVVVGYSLTAGFSFVYICQPIAKYWDTLIPGTCLDIYTQFLASACLNSTTDVVLLLLPVWLLWPLRVPPAQKIAVGLVLMPGGL